MFSADCSFAHSLAAPLPLRAAEASLSSMPDCNTLTVLDVSFNYVEKARCRIACDRHFPSDSIEHDRAAMVPMCYAEHR